MTEFPVSERQLEWLVTEALRRGGDWCDLYFENSVHSDLLLRDSVVASGGFNIDCGCGVRVLCGEKTGYAYSESLSMGALRDAVRSASAIALSGRDGNSSAIPLSGRGGNSSAIALSCRDGNAGDVNPVTASSGRQFYSMQQDWRETAAAELVPKLEKLEHLIRRSDSRVVKVIASLSSQVSDILMYNSLGETTRDTRPLGSLSVSVIFRQGDRTETQSASRSYRGGAEILSERLLEEVAALAVQGIDERFAARRPKGGRMPVVMGAGASGILLHEAMGHAFEADFNRKGQSVFSEQMGRMVCPEGITIVDDATIPGCRGSLNLDDEGVPGQRTVMVEDGRLVSYLHDRISASWYGVSPTGNGRRESFRYAPIPRMRTTYMEGGTDGSAEDIIRRVRKGIYVDNFSNGQVKIGEGDFTFFVKSGFLIEGGRLTMPVKDINIIGNGPRALADITAVGGDLRIDDGAWTCGKEQSVPVSCGIPTVLIKELTVGGV